MPATTWSTVRAGDALPAKLRLDFGGSSLAYLTAGPLHAPAVLFVHGFPRNGYLWRGCIEPLAAAGWRAIAPDLPGLGESEAPQSADFSLRAQAGALDVLLEHLALREVGVVAEGAGGSVVLALAALRPGRVCRAVLDSPPDAVAPRTGVALAASLARGGCGEAVLAGLSTVRAVARLGLRSVAGRGPSDSAGDLYLRPLLSSPEARARTLAWLAALRRAEASEAATEFSRLSPLPEVLVRPGLARRAETAPRKLVGELLPFLGGSTAPPVRDPSSPRGSRQSCGDRGAGEGDVGNLGKRHEA